MSQQLFPLSSLPWAVVHIDGDAFFTSREKAIYAGVDHRYYSGSDGTYYNQKAALVYAMFLTPKEYA